MKKELALKAQSKALKAIKTLHSIVKLDADWTEKDMQLLKRGVGISIGTIEIDLLTIIYKEYPELDDLKSR
jgi:hypothetical protein